jgi:hypothetical protein
MSNVRGLVIELVRCAADGTPEKFSQAVLFDGRVLERLTSSTNKRRHWRAATYRMGGAVDPLDVTTGESWFGRWVGECERRGFTLLGKPFLMEANDAEQDEIRSGRMPRAMVLRINKARAELGVDAPWSEKDE